MTLVIVLLVLSGTPVPVGVPRTFEDEAAQAVWAWRTSGAAERWRDGFLPVGELSAMPPDAGRVPRQALAETLAHGAESVRHGPPRSGTATI
uniref:Uncharacterized protein n=1 Tax=Nonomuraea gerenzanensis TaxID=93944 RepID=A0A1M4EQV1_9ACTN|nr:hypothetical protein BN4615_P10732 [Nonomuraea gerenzanensis]